jgi:hypothetical protein
MVLQIGADAGTVGDNIDTVLGEMRSRADARKHQELGRIEGRSGDDHFTPCFNNLNRSANVEFDTCRTVILNHNAPRQASDETHVFAFERRLQIGLCRRPALPLVDGLLHQAEAFLARTVVILGDAVACLTAGLDEGLEQRIGGRPSPDMQRSVGAAPAFLAADAATLVRGFHALEIGQHVGKRPAGGTLVRPVVEVLGMAAHENHAVDRRRPADYLAARGCQSPVAEIGFGLGGVAPVIDPHVHRVGQCRRHLDEGTEIRSRHAR